MEEFPACPLLCSASVSLVVKYVSSTDALILGIPMHMDVSDPASIDGAASKIRSEFGRLDIVVNSAGILAGDGNIVRGTFTSTPRGSIWFCRRLFHYC